MASTITLTDHAGPFELTLLEAAQPRRLALFSVGAGGNPERHLPLLTAFAEGGITVLAPHFPRITSLQPTDDELLLRASRLRLALDRLSPVVAPSKTPPFLIVGVGHSIGATLLLAMAGGRMWTRQGRRLPIDRDSRLQKFALLAPAIDFFRAPAALDAVQAPILVWAGANDTITPPDGISFLAQQLTAGVPLEVHTEDGAGHFSFMHVLPPNVTDPLSNRDAFLTRLTNRLLSFALA